MTFSIHIKLGDKELIHERLFWTITFSIEKGTEKNFEAQLKTPDFRAFLNFRTCDWLSKRQINGIMASANAKTTHQAATFYWKKETEQKIKFICKLLFVHLFAWIDGDGRGRNELRKMAIG